MSALKERLYYREDGAGMVEYALLVALIGVLLIGALTALRGGIETTFGNAETELQGTGGAGGE
jgi:pilus assembly protein Flp/PilA